MYHVIKVQGGGGGNVSLYMLILAVLSFTLHSPCPQGGRSVYPLSRKLVGSQSCCGHFGERKVLPVLESSHFSSVVHSVAY
jgi:hypothetical protein